ncbi:hypothetical protein DV515_00018707, partial [Chloebia gouldiae]
MGGSCLSVLICSSPLLQFFATLLFPQENIRAGIMGFLPRDILIAVWRAAQKIFARQGLPELSPDTWNESPHFRSAVGQILAPSSCTEGLAQEPPPRSGHILCPARSPGAAWGGPEAAADGAAWHFLALLRLWPERGHHHVLQGGLWQMVPPTVCQGGRLRMWRLLQSQAPIAPSAWSLAWFHRDCIQVGAIPSAQGTAGAQQHQGLAHLASVCPAGTRHARWTLLPSLPPKRSCKVCVVPGHDPAVLALPCPMSLGFSFLPSLEKYKRKSWDDLRNSSAFPFSIRQPTWEENDAYADLGERHSRCNARDCLYPGGRDEAEEDGLCKVPVTVQGLKERRNRRTWPDNHFVLSAINPFAFPGPGNFSCAPPALLRAPTGAAPAWKTACAGLGTGMRQSTRCPWAGGSAQAGPGRAPLLLKGWGLACLGPGWSLTFLLALTASRDKPELSGPSLTTQSGLEPTHGSPESEAISSSSIALVPSGLETRNHSSRQRTAQQQSLSSSLLDTSSPSTTRPANSSTPETEDGGHSRHGGPGRRRTRYRQQVRSRSRRDRRSRTRLRNERPRRMETRPRAFPRRRRSRQQGRALSPPVRNDRTAPRTERPRPRETSSGTSPRRSHSRLQRQGSNQPLWSRRRAANAERPRHMRTPSGRSHRSNGSSQRRRASTGTSNSSTEGENGPYRNLVICRSVTKPC